jgi:hypothetical protein
MVVIMPGGIMDQPEDENGDYISGGDCGPVCGPVS